MGREEKIARQRELAEDRRRERQLAQDWARLEYEELNRYGRLVYETIFRLARMTFVINPGLCAAFYYIFFEKRGELGDKIGFFALAIPCLGFVYNLGAYGVYTQSHAFIQALLLRILAIDRRKNSELHVALKEAAPYSYKRFWREMDDKRYGFSDGLTRLFLHLIALGWLIVLTYSIRVLSSGAEALFTCVEFIVGLAYCVAAAAFLCVLKPMLARRESNANQSR